MHVSFPVAGSSLHGFVLMLAHTLAHTSPLALHFSYLRPQTRRLSGAAAPVTPPPCEC